MTDKKRRQFVTVMGASAVAIPVSALIGSLPSHADDSPMVDPESAAAQTWEYIELSTVTDNMCGTCALYQGNAEDEAAGCPLFPGAQVANAGWCKAFAPKPS